MSLFNIFSIAGSAMSAQSVRLNTVASNIANAESVSGSPEEVYRAKKPVFEAVRQAVMSQRGFGRLNAGQGVQVKSIAESNKAPRVQHNPDHPSADSKGNVYLPDINIIEEMANMISASRAFQTNVQVAQATKRMLERTLTLGQ